MRKPTVLIAIFVCLVPLSHAQLADDEEWGEAAPPKFEVYDRVAHRLGMQRQEFIQTYLEHSDADSDNPWQTRSTPCPFLKDNLCSIYEDRPAECSGYPYLYKPNFVARTLGMVERTFTCPIVYEVMEELKKSLGFPRKSKPSRTSRVKDPRR